MIQLISSLDNTQEKPYLPTSIFGEDLEVYFGAKLYCPHAVGDGSQCIPFQNRPVGDGFFSVKRVGTLTILQNNNNENIMGYWSV